MTPGHRPKKHKGLPPLMVPISGISCEGPWTTYICWNYVTLTCTNRIHTCTCTCTCMCTSCIRTSQVNSLSVNLFVSETVSTRNFIFNRRSADVLTRIPFFESFDGSRVNTPRGCDICFSESKGFGAPGAEEKRPQ